MKKKTRDVTKTYTLRQFISKITRLAKDLKKGEQFVIQVANEKIKIPKNAKVTVEHERGKSSEELEFQITWKL